VVHLGFGVDPKTQVPNRLDAVGVPSVLVGKVADIVENPNGRLVPGVDTEEVLRVAADTLRELDRGFVCVNVQETDLAGHREDPGLYASRLVLADRGIADIVGLLGPEDLLVVTADTTTTRRRTCRHREKTPILVHGAAAAGLHRRRLSLADTGATAAEFFGAAPPQFGPRI
jgi:phosphopentomutase